jgi:hypothetical protein
VIAFLIVFYLAKAKSNYSYQISGTSYDRSFPLEIKSRPFKTNPGSTFSSVDPL